MGLIRDAGGVLLDYVPADENLPEQIRETIEDDVDHITDLHVWQLGPGHHGAILTIRSAMPQEPSIYRDKLAHMTELAHITVEVERKD